MEHFDLYFTRKLILKSPISENEAEKTLLGFVRPVVTQNRRELGHMSAAAVAAKQMRTRPSGLAKTRLNQLMNSSRKRPMAFCARS